MNARGHRAMTVAGTLAGLALLGLALRAAGGPAIVARLHGVGVGFLGVLALAATRLALRGAAWSACAPTDAPLPAGSAVAACFVGEAVGNVTPLGLAASEPAKVIWVRRHCRSVDAAASLAIETSIYSLVVAVVLVAGTVLSFACAGHWSAATLVMATATGAGVATVAAFVAWRSRVLHAVAETAARRWHMRGWWQWLLAARARAGETLDELARRRPAALWSTLAIEAGFQVLSVAEVYLTLVLVDASHPSWLQAFLLDFVNRAVTIAFKFVPFRLGVDEMGSALMTGLIGSGSTAGVAVALVRKARLLCCSLPGLALLGGRVWMAAAREA